jgi:hypothetical protein
VEEAARHDADWRWDDLQASRPAVADKENAALQIDKVAEHLPESWLAKDSPLLNLTKPAPPVRLDPEEVQTLRAELQRLGPALAESHALTRFRTGRFPSQGAVESFTSDQGHLKRTRAVAHLLEYEATLLAQEGKVSEAIVSARTTLHAGRAIGDEPGSMAMLIRLACLGSGIRGVERALAQGEASDAVLAVTAKFMDEEDLADWLTPALRGERAQLFEVYDCLEAGDLERLTGGEDVMGIKYSKTTFGKAEVWLKAPWFRENHARALEWTTRAVENARLPEAEQSAAFEQLRRDILRTHTGGLDSIRWGLARGNVIKYQPVAKASLRMHAELRCAAAALAAERYRLAKGEWPESLHGLVPAYLPAVPKDPFSGEALRLRRVEDGLVIYSVGEDGKDDGGNLQHLTEEKYSHIDYGFRLWDVKHRHTSPPSGEGNNEGAP